MDIRRSSPAPRLPMSISGSRHTMSSWFVGLVPPSHWVIPCGLFAAFYLGAVAVPPAVERLYVGPNQITLEQPYLLRSIAGTREGYNLDGASVEEREFAVSAV